MPASEQWRALNLIARCYLDTLQSKVSCGHRIDKLSFQELEGKGLVEVTERNEKGDMKAWKIIKGKEDEAEQVLEEFSQTRGHLILARHKKSLEHEMKLLIKDAMELIEQTQVWEWCKRVKGLGPVGALTFLAYINPERCDTAGKFWAYAGFTPDSKMHKGVRASFNPEIKGRLSFCCGNTIMHKDPYYYNLFIAKKDYYKHRVDTDMMKEEGVKGVDAKVNARAKMWLTKLIISNAIEIIRTEHGMSFGQHRGHIPPKPEDPDLQKQIITAFIKQQLHCVDEINGRVARGVPVKEAIQRLTWPTQD